MKILIIDDDQSFAVKLKQDLFFHFSSLDDDVTIDIGNETLDITNIKYELCFLDIDLGNYNGIELAKQMKSSKVSNKIIFITAHQHLVYDSLIVHPFFFIRKGMYNNDLCTLFELLSSTLENPNFITIKWNYEKKIIKMEDVIFIKAEDHFTIINTKDGEYQDRRTMKLFINENRLDGFVQIHKSYFINLKFLLSYSNSDVILAGNIRLKIGRTYKDNFLDKYQEFLVR